MHLTTNYAMCYSLQPIKYIRGQVVVPLSVAEFSLERWQCKNSLRQSHGVADDVSEIRLLYLLQAFAVPLKIFVGRSLNSINLPFSIQKIMLISVKASRAGKHSSRELQQCPI
jgi:hypothetical protein